MPPDPTAAGKRTFKLTPELHDKIVGYIAIGNYPTVTATACGIGETTWRRWMEWGREFHAELTAKVGDDVDLDDYVSLANVRAQWPDADENRHACWRLWRDVTKARAEAEVYAVGIVRRHMSDQWTAAMTFLERTAPDRWKRRELHEVAAAQASEQLTDEERLLMEPGPQAAISDALRQVRQLGAGDSALSHPPVNDDG